jgi:rod shape-determining protein MreC
MVETRGGRPFAVLFFVAAFLVLFLGRWIKPVNDTVLSVAAPFAAVMNGAATGVGSVFSGIFEAGQLRSQNEVLRKQNAKYVRELILAQAQRHENALLRRMVNFQDGNSQMDFLAASVISSDTVGLGNSYVLIDKGSRDGLRQGMTVLDQNGYFVGSISDLTGNAAKVILMENPSSSIGAVDLATRARGLVEGGLSGPPEFRYVITADKIRRNDLIVTSGQYNLYPRNILLGQVVRVKKRADEVFQTATVRPAADIQHLELVQVIRNWVPSAPARLIGNH